MNTLKPRYQVPYSSINPARACIDKQFYNAKIYRDFEVYTKFKRDPTHSDENGITEELNL